MSSPTTDKRHLGASLMTLSLSFLLASSWLYITASDLILLSVTHKTYKGKFCCWPSQNQLLLKKMRFKIQNSIGWIHIWWSSGSTFIYKKSAQKVGKLLDFYGTAGDSIKIQYNCHFLMIFNIFCDFLLILQNKKVVQFHLVSPKSLNLDW